MDLLAGYESESSDEGQVSGAKSKASKESFEVESNSEDEREEFSHGPLCECDTCGKLLQMYCIKNIKMAGGKFRCRLCSKVSEKRGDLVQHLQILHSEHLQIYKQDKDPKLFESKAKEQHDDPKKAFRVDAVLGHLNKRRKIATLLDEPAKRLGLNQPKAPAQVPTALTSAAVDHFLDGRISDLQWTIFLESNLLEITMSSFKCILCGTEFDMMEAARAHMSTHTKEYAEERGRWERFCKSAAGSRATGDLKCAVCSTAVADVPALARHFGKEVFMQKSRTHGIHYDEWRERWENAENNECCGNGTAASSGLIDEDLESDEEENPITGVPEPITEL